jgi:hypothetical protein
MTVANAEYKQAVNRASQFISVMITMDYVFISEYTEDLHSQISQFLRMMLEETNIAMSNVELG